MTLTTDFGSADSFVGTMKGVLLSRCPSAQLVDLCHEVPAQDVRRGALRLAAAAPYFPAGTVHLAVVDPGVGSSRRAIAVEAGRQRFVGPDNGLLSLAVTRMGAEWRAVELTHSHFWLPTVSHTFHGRDVFAPVAAYLAGGGAFEALGPVISSIVELALPAPRRADDALLGLVLDVDRFGNLITNVRESDLAGRRLEDVAVGDATITGLSGWYDPDRALVALIDSEGWLEVAAPRGSAAARLGVGRDASVRVRLGPATPAAP